MKNYTLERIKKEKYKEADWKYFFEFRQKYSKSIDEKLSFKNWEELRDRNIHSLDKGIGLYILWKNGKEAGHFCLEKFEEAESNRKLVVYHKQNNREKLNKEFLKTLFQAFLKFQPSAACLEISSENEEGDFILEQFEVEIVEKEFGFELKTRYAENDIIDLWVEESPAKFPGYELKFFNQIPKELAQEYCDFFNELVEDIPGNPQREKPLEPKAFIKEQAGNSKDASCTYSLLVLNEEKKVVGMTNIFVDKLNKEYMHQFMTGVKKEYRRKGIAKWLKGSMYHRIRADFPEISKIRTRTTPENIPSQMMNKKMGFEKINETQKVLIRKDEILDFLYSS